MESPTKKFQKEVRKMQTSLTESEHVKGVKNKKIAKIRELDFKITEKALEVAKMELRDEIVKIIQKDLVDRSFASEESFCSFIDHSLDEKLSQREIDLVCKFSSDISFR